jgi:ADP-ribose pyrophosphatase YjhB (NUDIX family)
MNKFAYCPVCGVALKDAVVAERVRQVCSSETCDFVHWDNPTPVVAAIVQQDDAVVLVRSRGWPDEMFGLVTGFLERGESPAAGVLREVKEELGLDGGEPALVGVYGFEQMHQVILAYHVLVWGEVTLGEELEAFKRVAVARLKPWPFGTGHAVRDWLAKREAAGGV